MGLAPAPRLMVTLRAAFACAAALATCACADLPDLQAMGPPPIDQTSPVARDVAAASGAQRPYPRFEDIPLAPRDIRPVRAYTRSIYDILRLRRQMIVATAVAGPAPTDTEAFYRAQRDRAAVPASPSAVAAQQMGGATGAFAAGIRERATPPSPAR